LANETKNQEFNRAIKQLQSMVKDKLIISLAEKFYNLKTDMSSFTRTLKEKESAIILQSTKTPEPEPKVEEKVVTPEPAPAPVIEAEKPKQRPNYNNQNYNNQTDRRQPYQQQNQQYNRNNQNNNYNHNSQRYNQNNNYNQNNGQRNFNQNRPFNKPFNNQNNNGQQRYQNNGQRPFNNQAGNRPQFNRDNNKRPSINYAQPIITATPARNFNNKPKDNNRYEEKHAYNKRDLIKRGIIEANEFEDREVSRKVRTKKKEEVVNKVERVVGPVTINTENITIKLLSELSGKPVSEIIKKFMILGMMVTINSTIDFGTAELVMSDMGIELIQKLDKTSEEKLIDVQKDIRSYSEAEAVTRPPIVTVMGHVDHGKTSLLDYIRKTKVTSAEAGGITQAIGAYRVNVKDKYITFIDTPGHEAFTAMRARGASVTDIAILIVAADDGIMPQTVEAINHIKSANIPMIVAINKMDKQQANPDRILQQLAENNVLPEEWGGDAIICKISAHTGEGIDKLLETILLVAEVQNLKANPNVHAMGTILESRLDKGKGAIASLIVMDGSLKVGDTIVCGTTICKVKAMMDENGKSVKVASPSMPVTVLGFNEVPNAGEAFTVVDEKLSKQIVEDRKAKIKEDLIKNSGGSTLEDLIQKSAEKDMKVLNLIVKTDVHGSLEAIKASVSKLENEEVKINILHSGVGAINESDLILANASSAMVVAFNVGQDSKVKTLAGRMKVTINSYKIIYELIDDIERAVKGLKEPKYEEVYVGKAEVIAVFKLSTAGLVAGCRVTDGKIVRGEHAKIYRGDELIATTDIHSVKIVKDDVKEALKDRECGIKFGYEGYAVGDRIECFSLKRIED